MPTEKWNATDYAKHSTQQLKWANEVIAKLPMAGAEAVLDIGCGDGKITALLSKKSPNGQVIGIDSSQNMIDEAVSRFTPQKYPNLSFQKKDASKLRFRNQFDIIFSNAALHWIKEHKAVLQGIYRALKPGGKCFLSFGGHGNGKELFAAINKVIDTPKWRPHFENFEAIWAFHHSDDYKAWVLEAGLTPLRVELVPKQAIYPNQEGLIGYLRTAWHQYNRYLPDEKINLFASEVVATYLKKQGLDANGNIAVTMVRLEVEAIKHTIKSKRYPP